MLFTVAEEVLTAAAWCPKKPGEPFDSAALETLIARLTGYLERARPLNEHLVLEPAYEDGVCTGLCVALNRTCTECLGSLCLDLSVPKARKAIKVLIARLRRVQRHGYDSHLQDILLKVHDGMMFYAQNEADPRRYAA